MSFFNVTNELDHSKFFAAKLWFFLENNAINFFNVCQNIVQLLNMFHNIASNLKNDKFVIVRDFWFFHFYIVYKRERMMKNMICDDETVSFVPVPTGQKAQYWGYYFNS
jgi:hypothetical protein